MTTLSELGRILHEEHFRILVLICGIEHRVNGAQAETPPDPFKAEDRAQLLDLSDSLDELLRHNAFEDSVVFPLLCSGRKGDLGGLLSEEHGIIGPLTERLRHHLSELVDGGPGAGRWTRFCRTARHFVAQMMDHLQNEELSLVQRLPLLIDADVDRSLAERYRAERSPCLIGPAFQTPG
jgi:iron-sulfur cluster repair protein YtfE (RIC family)